MKLLNFNKVLCLSPHPDDVEYGMLGSMIKFKDTRFDVLTTSIGGNFDKSSNKTRFDECKQVVSNIDNINTQLLEDVDYLKNTSEDEMISKIESKYSISDYQAIFIPPEEDTHQDHKKVSVIGKSLTRKSKCGIVAYKTPHTLHHWVPNFFVDLSDNNVFDEKVDRLSFFESQQHQPYFMSDSLKSFHSDYQCSRRFINVVEQFRIIIGYN